MGIRLLAPRARGAYGRLQRGETAALAPDGEAVSATVPAWALGPRTAQRCNKRNKFKKMEELPWISSRAA